MNYEKEYKKLKAGIKNAYLYAQTNSTKAVLENILPELRESEDERIRNEIIAFTEQAIHRGGGTPIPQEQEDSWIAWLEKQGSNNIKWNKNTKDNKPQVNHSVLMQTIYGIAEGEWRGEDWYQYRWSGIIKDNAVIAWIELSDIEKQSKESKVEEAMCEVEEKAEAFTAAHQGERKPAWSEEDGHRAEDTIYFLDTAKKHYASTVELDACIDWLKSLKDKVQPQPKQEWSEGDECYMSECIGAIATKNGWSFEEKRKTKLWLFSIKQRIGG